MLVVTPAQLGPVAEYPRIFSTILRMSKLSVALFPNLDGCFAAATAVALRGAARLAQAARGR